MTQEHRNLEIKSYPHLSDVLDSDEYWEKLGDFDRLMKGWDDRLQSIDGTSDVVEVAKLIYEFSRNHYHLFLVGQYKVREIGRGIKAALDTNNETVLFNLTRAFIENTAALAYQTNALEQAITELPKKTDSESIRETIAYHQRKANSLYINKSAEIHVHDMLKELGKYSENLRQEYDQFCEFVHPNYGSNKLVSSGVLGTGQIRSHANELKEELAAARQIIERCAMLVGKEFTTKATYFLGIKLASWIEVACQDGAKLSQIFSQRAANIGDGKTKESAIFFKKARTHQEAMQAFYDYLRANRLNMLDRETAAVEGGHLYDKVTTDKGTLWVKYKMLTK